MNILGISAYYHDSAAALVQDGKIVAAAQQERFSRIKHDPAFPAEAIQYCLDEAGIQSTEIDFVAFYDKPLLKFERLLDTYYGFAPKGFLSFRQAIPIWVKEKIFLKDNLKRGIKELGGFDRKRTQILFPEHHLSHAASAFYPSPFAKAAILTIDGVGEWATASIALGEGKDIRILRELKFPHSLGLLYSAFTYFLGFKVNSGEYKLMGLAPYGNAGSKEVADYVGLIHAHLLDLKADGSLLLAQKYFSYATGTRMVPDARWAALFGMPRREPEGELTQAHCDLALAIQQVTEEVVLRLARTAKALTGAEHLCMAGGVALNCVANGKLMESGLFKDIFVQPAAGDAGGALGAALAAWHIHAGQERVPMLPDSLQGSQLGPSFSDAEVEHMARKRKAVAEFVPDFGDLAKLVASELANGKGGGMVPGPHGVWAAGLGQPQHPGRPA
jgi:carbamoyltransferase